jgi:hypothetical protein
MTFRRSIYPVLVSAAFSLNFISSKCLLQASKLGITGVRSFDPRIKYCAPLVQRTWAAEANSTELARLSDGDGLRPAHPPPGSHRARGIVASKQRHLSRIRIRARNRREISLLHAAVGIRHEDILRTLPPDGGLTLAWPPGARRAAPCVTWESMALRRTKLWPLARHSASKQNTGPPAALYLDETVHRLMAHASPT